MARQTQAWRPSLDRIDDFEIATRLTRLDEHVWSGLLREDWGLWGPAGGFVTALALRAAGEATEQARPVSMSCHFVRVGQFQPVTLTVQSIRKGRRSELLRVEMAQEDRLLFSAQVWAMPDDLPGIEHDVAHLKSLPDPETLPTWEDLFPDDPPFDFVSRIDQRPLKTMPKPGDAAREPELTGFYRYKETASVADPFIDAARPIILMDTFGWLAQYPAHPEDDPSPWIAPNVDYYYRFFRPTMPAGWLHMTVRADLATGGLMGTEGAIHDREGRLLVTGHSQLMCLPRPGA